MTSAKKSRVLNLAIIDICFPGSQAICFQPVVQDFRNERAVLKVFLYDLAQLEGILRALSFIGLGGVLISIGLVYQKLIFRRSSQT